MVPRIISSALRQGRRIKRWNSSRCDESGRVQPPARPLRALPSALRAGISAAILFVFAQMALPQPNVRTFPLRLPASGQTGFRAQASSVTGIHFTNGMPESRFKTNQILLNGSGVAAGDVDGDGKCDLYFAGLHGPNALYRNLGNWRFENITASSGVACDGMDSTGVALADLDGDRDLDLVVNSVGHGTRVFFNDGKARFTELTARAPLNARRGGMSMALGDVDGDGWLDLYVANYRTMALMDMPNTRFWMVRRDGQQVVSTVNGRPVTDPDLADRFVVTPRGGIEELGEADVLYRNVGGTNFVPIPFTGGNFLDEDGQPLAKPPFEWGLAVMFRDIDQDGRPDLYVCNDFDSPDRIWMNQGGGKFRALPRLALRKLSLFSMGVDFADINRDGFDDIFVVDMMSRDHVRRMNFLPDRKPHVPFVGELDNRPQYARNTLFLNRGDGTYAEMASLAGVQGSEWSWCPVFLDVDLDGWEDLLVTNGHERDARNMDKVEQMKIMRAAGKLKTAEETFDARSIFPRLATANVAFRNNRDLTFHEVGQEWGFDYAGVSHGMALADLDDDGDLDVIVNNLNAAPSVLRNETMAPRVAVRLKGQRNTAGIGARIKVSGGPVTQQQEMIAGGRYLASDQPLRVFAAGGLTNILSIEVLWPGGQRSVVSGVKANSLCEIEEPDGDSSPSPLNGERAGVRGGEALRPTTGLARETNHPSSPTLLPVEGRREKEAHFQDVSSLLNHSHVEEPFDDFAIQPLLPNKLSQAGPGVSWCDVDGDGWDDIVIPSGKGGTLAVFRNDQRGAFTRLSDGFFNRAVPRDQTTALCWPKPGGQFALLIGSSNWEDSNTNDSCATEYDLKSRMNVNRLPGSPSSTGPLALADVDGDGDLDLFVGGRAMPGRYPSSASSLLFRNLGGRWELDATNSSRLANLGLVNGAVFSDLTGDGRPELLLACAWGPIRIFRNAGGIFQEVTDALGLVGFKGWWNGVATGDLDGDGRMDIVASNWGRNTRYEWHRAQPLRIYFGNLGGDGSTQIIEAHFDAGVKKIVPERGLDFLAKTMPAIRARFPTYDSYAHAGVQEMIGDPWGEAKVLEANWLESTVFLNRATGFVTRALPVAAQMAPAFGVCVADLDGDGNEDVFLAQNFFATQIETPRYDGGLGLWLKGNGRGDFVAVEPAESGVSIFGEQRGAALADYDSDGRLDLLVGQNGQATKLFRNQQARPGLRIRLNGPPNNPHAIGAQIRIAGDGREGAVREVQAGAGYWSQSSAVQVLSRIGTQQELIVRWPDGNERRVPLRSETREVVIGVQNPAIER